MPYIHTAAIVSTLQIILALGLVNVWLLRFHKQTAYRGKGAGNMTEEFHAYGLPPWFMYCVGASKLAIAGLLIAGLWMSFVVYPAAVALSVLMLGAIAMHLKVHDPLMRTLPAIAVLSMTLAIIVLTQTL